MKKIIIIVIACTLPNPVWGQANDLASGLQNRIVKLGGTTPERNSSGDINAGYFRMIVEDSGAANAAICPKVKYQQVKRVRRQII